MSRTHVPTDVEVNEENREAEVDLNYELRDIRYLSVVLCKVGISICRVNMINIMMLKYMGNWMNTSL